MKRFETSQQLPGRGDWAEPEVPEVIKKCGECRAAIQNCEYGPEYRPCSYPKAQNSPEALYNMVIGPKNLKT